MKRDIFKSDHKSICRRKWHHIFFINRERERDWEQRQILIEIWRAGKTAIPGLTKNCILAAPGTEGNLRSIFNIKMTHLLLCACSLLSFFPVTFFTYHSLCLFLCFTASGHSCLVMPLNFSLPQELLLPLPPGPLKLSFQLQSHCCPLFPLFYISLITNSMHTAWEIFLNIKALSNKSIFLLQILLIYTCISVKVICVIYITHCYHKIFLDFVPFFLLFFFFTLFKISEIVIYYFFCKQKEKKSYFSSIIQTA